MPGRTIARGWRKRKFLPATGFFFLSRLVVQATEGRKELGNIKYSITHKTAIEQ